MFWQLTIGFDYAEEVNRWICLDFSPLWQFTAIEGKSLLGLFCFTIVVGSWNGLDCGNIQLTWITEVNSWLE